MSSDIAIKVSNVCKYYQVYNKPIDRLKQSLFRGRRQYYNEFKAVDNVSFEVKKGETVGIIGRNGSGKSTLLQMICGTLTPTSGEVSVHGRIAALLELGAGFNPEFTGKENVYMNAAILGLSREEIDERFDDIVRFSDIGDFIEQPVKTYSSGMYVRLAFAVIAHVDADILVIDEALAVGDAIFVQRCNRFIREFKEHGTLLFVSHSNQAILDLCDRGIWINKGKCIKDDIATTVVREYSAFTSQQLNKGVEIKVAHVDVVDMDAEDMSDHRLHALEQSNLRYDLRLFEFNGDSSSWGARGARITDVVLYDISGRRLTVINKYMKVELQVHCCAIERLSHPVVGFTIRNYRGIELISENTHLSYTDGRPPEQDAGQNFYASFRFHIPYLAPGDYFIGAAIADGYPGQHVQHDRLDEALKITVTSSHVVYGLFSMPLTQCEIITCSN